MGKTTEKRRRIVLTQEETGILKSLFFKALLPAGIIILISSFVLIKGLYFLFSKTCFYNYGVSPGISSKNAADFFYTYLSISCVNIVLMVALAAIVCYIALHNIILPILRITRELKNNRDNNTRHPITVRAADTLLAPLAAAINTLIEKAK